MFHAQVYYTNARDVLTEEIDGEVEADPIEPDELLARMVSLEK